MLKRLTVSLPAWARPGHPLLRRELARTGRTAWRAQLVRDFLAALLLLAIGVLLTTDFLRHLPGLTLTERAATALYWPLLAAQVALNSAAVAVANGAVHSARRRRTWDSVRATAGGTELALRAQWTLVFYRLGGPLAAVLLLRALLVGGVLFDLLAFQGRYLSLLTSSLVPPVSLLGAALLLACTLSAGLLLPVTGLGLAAATGLWLSAALPTRMYTTMAQIGLVLAQLALVAALTLAATSFISGGLPGLPDAAAWALLLAHGAAGDQALALLNLEASGIVWATVPFGILLGPALLLLALAQAAASDWVLARAVHRAELAG